MLRSVLVLPPRAASLASLSTVLGLMGLWAPTIARANPAGEVPSAADPGNPIDLHIRLDYEYQIDRSLLTRERVGAVDTDPLNGISKSRDLEFHQYRHVLTPRAELGIYHDTYLSLSLPIIIAQARELELASGVDRPGSSTIDDGLLPMAGFDARDPGTAPPGNLVFRGVSRGGLDQLHLGLAAAPMSQHRDDTKPTWKIGAELLLSVGKIMKFDPMNPGSETGTSKGVHEARVFTSVDRTFDRFEGWFELFWQAPIATKSGSLFKDPGLGSTNASLSQQAGISFGAEAYALDDKQNGNRISIDVGSRIVGHFEGRDYTEMWEVFTYAGDTRLGGPLILDADPLEAGIQPTSHPGISNVENYRETACRFAVRASLGPKVRFAALVDLTWKTDHAISFADAGVDLPTCGGSATNCEDDANDLVNPGTREVNPLHAPKIDLVGHRYFSEDNFGLIIGIEGQVLF
ncbi:hypothetical protein BH11MYX3_BH11MYX3_41120 [soil metagenome]